MTFTNPIVVAAALSLVATSCKTNDIASTINNNDEGGASVSITSAGGTFAGPDGLVVSVPAGAVSATVQATFTTVPSGHEPIPADETLISPVFSLEPHGQAFAMPVTVYLPYAPTSLASGEMAAVIHAGTTNPATAPWDAPIAGTAGPPASADGVMYDSVKITTSSFSFYAVVSLPIPQDGGGD